MKLADIQIDPIVNESGRAALQMLHPNLTLQYASTRFLYEVSQNTVLLRLADEYIRDSLLIFNKAVEDTELI